MEFLPRIWDPHTEGKLLCTRNPCCLVNLNVFDRLRHRSSKFLRVHSEGGHFKLPGPLLDPGVRSLALLFFIHPSFFDRFPNSMSSCSCVFKPFTEDI